MALGTKQRWGGRVWFLAWLTCAWGPPWILNGAPSEPAAPEREAADWWSFQPVRLPELPSLNAQEETWARHPIDAFVLAKLREKGLTPSAEADRATLIRRVYFDLIGLPPAPKEVEAFRADPDPMAYEKLVDHLLDSPRHGERWARHWLDVVHYGDTHGYDKDKPRPHAWPYRDYVIRAFNEDKPYGRFVREQIAGDVLYPDTRDGIEALGFIATGPWDFIGHAEVSETKRDGKIARHLDRDDMVANTMSAFTSLTVHCAQCHDHKFDPVTQEDYYRLQAVFAALDRADKPYDIDPQVRRQRRKLKARENEWTARQASLHEKLRVVGGPTLAALDAQIESLNNSKPDAPRPEFGYHSAIAPKPDDIKWVQVDLGTPTPLNRIVLAGCHDDFNGIGAGFGFPTRYKVELSDDPEFREDAFVVEDRMLSDVANPGIEPRTIVLNGQTARYIRVTATRLALRQNDYIFALAELEAYDTNGVNAARGGAVQSLDSIEAPARWATANLVDGIYPAATTPAGKESLAQLQEQRAAWIAQSVDAVTIQELAIAEANLAEIREELASLPPRHQVYAGTIHHGSGTFLGTGPDGGEPRAIHVLHRGDVENLGPEVGPGAVAALGDSEHRFALSPDASEGAGRAALARWLTDPSHPLTWRSIVNRVWLYHFGRGLVDTPNDFGRMGQTPSHPELLDWLAASFRDGGQSLKALHRWIVTSATYRQSSSAQLAASDRARSVDGDNVYYWRMNRRRLEAEAIRDTVLAVSGKLNLQMYGPGFQDFVIEKPEHSPHYQYHLHDPNDPATHRRSIYRFLVRSQQQPFMRTLDCADPSMMVDKRTESLSPLQALALLNNKFMLAMSGHFAARLDGLEGDLETKIARGFEEALGRRPRPEELASLTSYARSFGLANTCRVILNLNEFTFVD